MGELLHVPSTYMPDKFVLGGTIFRDHPLYIGVVPAHQYSHLIPLLVQLLTEFPQELVIRET